MFSLCNFIFQRLIWKELSVYFLRFHYWILKEWKAAKVENHSVSAYYLHKWLVHFLTFTGAMFIFSAVRFLNICKSKTGWPTSIGILLKWASKPTELAGDGKSCKLTRFHPTRNFLANEICNFSRLSYQTGYLFACAARSI